MKIRDFLIFIGYIVFVLFSMSLISAITGIEDPYFVALILIFIVVAVLYGISRRADKIAEKKEEEERQKRIRGKDADQQ